MKTEMKELNINELEQVNGGEVQIGDGPIDPPKRQCIPDLVPIKFVPIIAAC